MTRLSRRLLALYLATLIALAALGAHNQFRSSYQSSLLQQRSTLRLQLHSLRRDAARVTGALAVRSWAAAHQMVAAPEALNVREVDPVPAPEDTLPATHSSRSSVAQNGVLKDGVPEDGVEVQTLWR